MTCQPKQLQQAKCHLSRSIWCRQRQQLLTAPPYAQIESHLLATGNHLPGREANRLPGIDLAMHSLTLCSSNRRIHAPKLERTHFGLVHLMYFAVSVSDVEITFGRHVLSERAKLHNLFLCAFLRAIELKGRRAAV